MRYLVTSFFPKINLILTAKATAVGSICSPGELHAAARYLAEALVEYDLRSQEGIRDALYTPLDEVYWREDQAIKSAPNDQVLSQKIALARELRRQHFKEPERGPGGARHAVINAIRHAWLVCHEGSSVVNYARQTDSSSDHCGPLHDFIRSLTELLRTARNIDGLHREIRALDLQMHPSNKMP
ncbi:hypothetical protein [Pseudomonas defluvii]|uniref:hypothetical protein n=1 Tax=Pseudomonas defluvii TaxID=1876757 RepID=UPI0039066FBF